MRLTYVLTLVLATTLYASGTALHATTETTAMATKNVLSPNTVARVPTSEERLLRRVGNENYDADEEGGFFGKFRQLLQRLNPSKGSGKTTTQKTKEQTHAEFLEKLRQNNFEELLKRG
ncbi:RXLR domain-containing protein [Phytophthora infestans]|uniref:RxLR effector protein n=1 Tax=Phytophthora infestans TaxID=4787 RepID=A0A833SHD9_PHYIN|nr:RXLR domain-containing protein [Phytophthora infestans]